jgi:hypothetical protein
MKFADAFSCLSDVPSRDGYLAAIDASTAVISHINNFADNIVSKTAEVDQPVNKARLLGSIAQLWRSPELQRVGAPGPSSLGQMLVLGGLGALGGNLIGKGVNKFLPDDSVDAARTGTIVGGVLGASPGLAGAYFNAFMGRPVLTSSFYTPEPAIEHFNNPMATAYGDIKLGGFGYADPAFAPISVNEFQQTLWDDPRMHQLPLQVRAGASGLVQNAAVIPNGTGGTGFVTPLDVAKAAMGLGSGLVSGWIVGKTMGALFGVGKNTQNMLKNTGMAIGALRSIVPIAYGQQPFSFG